MRADDLDSTLAFETLAVHAGQEPDELTGAVAPPIYQTSTYAQDGVNRPRRGYDYARTVNPTRDRLQRAVAALEGGGDGIAFASGSAATAAISSQLAEPENIWVRERACSVSTRAPASSHRRAIATGSREPSSQPDRIFTVTGSGVVDATARMMSATSPMSRRQPEPPLRFTTFLTGQPKLMSMNSG